MKDKIEYIPFDATSVATKTSFLKARNSCTALFLSSWSLSPWVETASIPILIGESNKSSLTKWRHRYVNGDSGMSQIYVSQLLYHRHLGAWSEE